MIPRTGRGHDISCPYTLHRLKSVPHGFFSSLLVLRHPLHGEFLAFLGAVEKIKIDQFPVRKVGLVRKRAGREERFLRTHRGKEAGSRSFDPANASGMQKTQMTGGGGAQKLESRKMARQEGFEPPTLSSGG